jgi:hypothetical protein
MHKQGSIFFRGLIFQEFGVHGRGIKASAHIIVFVGPSAGDAFFRVMGGWATQDRRASGSQGVSPVFSWLSFYLHVLSFYCLLIKALLCVMETGCDPAVVFIIHLLVDMSSPANVGVQRHMQK